jgi:ribosomal protein L24
MAAKIKKGDQVVVLAGRDKGKKGEVIEVRPADDRVVVRGVNIVKRHTRQSRTSRMPTRRAASRPASASRRSRMAARSGSPRPPAK